MKILILEDNEIRHKAFRENFSQHDLVIVTTADEAIEQLQQTKFDTLFLDHDLGGGIRVDSFGKEKTGYTVAKFIKQNPQFKPDNIYIHSHNIIGAQNIKGILPDAILAPGLWMVKQ